MKNIEASIKARLKNKAQETNRPFAEVMQYYGMERFLYRFSKSKYADYEGVRVKFTGFLDRAEIPMQIDVGFGDIVYLKIKIIDYPVILDFSKPHLNGYPQESVISKKFEAMIKLGLLNSRMKDFYDIWLMTRQFEFKGTAIASAIKKTFNNQKTDIPNKKPLFADEIYDEKSDRQTLWSAFLKKGDIQHAPDGLVSHRTVGDGHGIQRRQLSRAFQ